MDENINKKEILEIQGVRSTDISDEMKSSYLNYAMSVIVARALPNAKDGMKPVQRRILYSMYRQGFFHNKPYKKSARTVGDVIGKYHPHGDTAVYYAMVRLAQDFNVRYLLVDGQGNFGSIDGDNPAAMRYTEARMQKISMLIIDEIDKNTTNFVANYDGSTKEPETLPSKLPILLLNGADGIAVGMATKIPPHNLTEIVNAIIDMLDAGNKADEEKYIIPDYEKLITTTADIEKLPKNRFPNFLSEHTVQDLMKYVQGPDFPTGAEIYDRKEIEAAYASGKGRILMRAVAKIEEIKGGKFQIVISEIPYQVNKARLVEKIANLVKDKVIQGISDIRDESNKEGLRVVIDIKRDGKPNTILNRLYKYTEMQKAFNMNTLALINNEPQLLSLKQALEIFIEHRQQVVIKRTEFDLGKSKEREHILEGLMIALDNLDEVISTIRNSKDSDTAKVNLMKKFKLSEIQSQAILDMQLRRLAALERQKIEDEYKEIKKHIKALLIILSQPEKVIEIIKSECTEIIEKYGDERRTKVFKGKIGEIDEDDLVAKEEVIVTISKQGYIKRMKQSSYNVQKRGGVGKKFMTTKDDDSVQHVLPTNTHDEILFFTTKGRVFKIKVYDIPDYGRTAKGQPIINLINIEQNEYITSVLTQDKEGKVLDEDIIQEGEATTENKGKNFKYFMMATKKGVVNKTAIDKFSNINNNGLIAIKLDPDDELIWVRPTTGNNEISLITRNARSIRFKESDVRETGRATRGVTGIKFKTKDDYVISMDVIRNTELFMMTISEKGYGKMTHLEQFPTQLRGGQGVYTAKINDKTGKIESARIIDHPQKSLLIMSKAGQAVTIPTEDLPQRNRQTSGVKLIRLKNNDKVGAIAII